MYTRMVKTSTKSLYIYSIYTYIYACMHESCNTKFMMISKDKALERTVEDPGNLILCRQDPHSDQILLSNTYSRILVPSSLLFWLTDLLPITLLKPFIYRTKLK